MGYAEAQYTVDEVINALQQMGANESGIPPVKPWVTVVPAAQSVKIYFTIKDTVIENQTVCHCKGVMIRKKLGSPITSLTDGDLVGIYEDDAAKSHGPEGAPITISGLENGVWVWIGVWAFSDHNVYNLDMSNVYQVQPGVDIIYGFHQDFTDGNPDTCISYIGANSQYEPMYTRAGINYSDGVYFNNNQTIKYAYHTTPTPSKEHTYGSWRTWEWLNKNQPFSLYYALSGSNKIPKKKHRLFAKDYRLDADTMVLESSLANPSDFSEIAGYFAWIPRIYMKEVYDADGNGRTVYFSETKLTSATSDFVNVGFKNCDGQELKGLWLGMNYSGIASDMLTSLAPTMNGSNVNLCDSTGNTNIESMKNVLATFSDKKIGRFFGGDIANVLRDILVMLYKSTNILEKAGYGMSVYLCPGIKTILPNYPHQSSSKVQHSFHSIGPAINGGSYGSPYMGINKGGYNNPIDSFYATPFGFFGIDASTFYSSWTRTPADASGQYTAYGYLYNTFGFAKLFHCFSLGTYAAAILDPNMVVYGNRLYIPNNYNYDLVNGVSDYKATSYYLPSSRRNVYPTKLTKVSNDFGSLPNLETAVNGSATTYLTDIASTIHIWGKTSNNTDPDNIGIGSLQMMYIWGKSRYNLQDPISSPPSTTDNGYYPSVNPNMNGPFALGGVANFDNTYGGSAANNIINSSSDIDGYDNQGSFLVPILFPPTNYTPYDDYEGGVPPQW